jgi:glycosyltransferase involved in cell wall biosynthesis
MNANKCNYSVSAIIPMHNEEENAKRIIGFAVETLTKMLDDWEILVVESGSTDNTRRIVEAIAAKDPRIIPIFQEKREGMGSALRAGYSRAKKQLIWHLESDSPFDLNDLQKALGYFNEYDGVIGYRTSSQADLLSGWIYSKNDKIENFIRGLFHIGYNLLIRLVFGLKVRDINFSFKIIKSDLIKKLQLSSNGWFIDAELLLEIKKVAGKIKEIGIDYKQREFGKSTVRIGTPIKIIKEMADYRFNRWVKEG